MPANKNNVGKKSQAPRGQKRGNGNPAPAQPPAKKIKMPPKGSREEAEKKLEHLRQDLRDVIQEELDIAKQKQSVIDRIKHWKKELTAREEVEALADALFETCVREVKKEEEEEDLISFSP